MLVDADTGGVDHDDLPLESGGNRSQQAIPHSGYAPAHEAIVTGGRWPVALGHLWPWRARAEPPENAIQHPPVINPRHTTRLVGQKRLDDRPFPIHEFVPSSRHQASIALEAMNQPGTQTATPFMSLPPNRCAWAGCRA